MDRLIRGDMCSVSMSDGAIWETDKGTMLRVIVKPRSKERDFFAELTDSNITINLKSPARGGKANIELLKRLAKILGVSTSEILLVSGHRSREKVLIVPDVTAPEVMSLLRGAVE